MSDRMPTWFINEKLRMHGHDDRFREEIVARIRREDSDALKITMLQERVAYLEQHVPPEIANPPKPETHRPRWTGD